MTSFENAEKMSDLISRQDVLALAKDRVFEGGIKHRCIDATQIHELPSVQPEQHFCRDCKWVANYGIVDKYGAVESSWYCKNWADSTDEEGFCHEWERKENE